MSARTSNLVAMMFLALLTVTAVVVLTVTGHDGAVLVVTGITGVLLTNLVTAYQGVLNGADLEEVKRNVNGNMTTLVNAKTQPDIQPVVAIAPTVDDLLTALVKHLASVSAVPGVVPAVQPPGVQSPPGTAQGA